MALHSRERQGEAGTSLLATIIVAVYYTDYDYEDLLKEVALNLKAQRKKNSKRPMPVWEEFLGKRVRKYIETVFSGITNLVSKKIHAVTSRAFELKIVWFLLAFAIQHL